VGVITVLVLHEGGLAGAALERALEDEPDLRVRVAGSAAQVPRLVRRDDPDVLVTDAGRSGPADLTTLVAGRRTRWVAQLRTDDGGRMGDLLVAGACGLFTDRTPVPGLVDAVRQVAAGRGWLAPELVPPLLREYLPYHRRRAAARARLHVLGANELRLLTLVAEGRTNADIAAELHLAVSTTKEYVGALLGRLGVTRGEAIALAVRADLPRLPPRDPRAR
jgi:DNA-binding NarL/FixJ family response regulator